MSARDWPWRGLTSAAALGLAAAPVPLLAQAVGSPFTTHTRYDALGRVTGTIAPDPDGAGPLPAPATRNTYDAAGNLVRVETGAITALPASGLAASAWTGFTVEVTTDYTYDAMGRRLTQRVRGSDGVTVSLQQFGYDSLGRQVCSTVRMNPAVFAAPPADACAAGPAGAQGADRITRTVYDGAGRVLQVRKAVGTADETADVTYSYTANGKTEFVIDANGNRARFLYDGLDSRIRWVFPSATRPTGYNPATPDTALATAGAANAADYEEYGYDANGNRTSLRKRDGALLQYDYDALNRVTRKTVPERAGLDPTHTRDVFYGYDLLGRQLYARFDSAAGPGVSNTWDGFGRQTASTLALDGTWTIGRTFDANGNPTATTHPDGAVVTMAYDGLDRPTRIQRPGAVNVASYGYNAFGRRNAFTTGVNTSYGYDPAGRLNALSHNPAGNAGLNSAWTFGFNPAGQIDRVTRSNDAFAFGQLYSVSRPYAVNGLNQYTSAGPAGFAYDANGNLAGDGRTSFAYDGENRLVSASGGQTAVLRYDPLGRLYEVAGRGGITRFLWDGDALLAEYDAGGTLLRRYVHGADARADDPVAWYEGSALSGASERLLRGDWQGSIVLATDSTGTAAIAVNSYDEWGIPGAGNQGRFQYTGQAWIPELGLYHYKARFYSPTLGRFLQTDPVGYDDQVNLYGYVGNDPVNGVDPTGMFNFGCVANQRGEAPNSSCSSASLAEDILNQREEAARLAEGDESAVGRTAAAGVGAVVGAGVGVSASAVCDGATAGVCAPANPSLVAGSTVAGGAFGVALYDAGKSAVKALAKAAQQIHGNDLNSPRINFVYKLVSTDGKQTILKFGITCNSSPTCRYTKTYYENNAAKMIILAQYDNRSIARADEFSRCLGYFALNGRLPPLSRRC